MAKSMEEFFKLPLKDRTVEEYFSIPKEGRSLVLFRRFLKAEKRNEDLTEAEEHILDVEGGYFNNFDDEDDD